MQLSITRWIPYLSVSQVYCWQFSDVNTIVSIPTMWGCSTSPGYRAYANIYSETLCQFVNLTTQCIWGYFWHYWEFSYSVFVFKHLWLLESLLEKINIGCCKTKVLNLCCFSGELVSERCASFCTFHQVSSFLTPRTYFKLEFIPCISLGGFRACPSVQIRSSWIRPVCHIYTRL